MTAFFLIRHGEANVPPGTLAGRQTGFGLTSLGESQVQQLFPFFAAKRITHIFASPVERTQRSAELIAEELHLPVETAEALNELDYGSWMGLTFDQLEPQSKWGHFNTFRSGTRIPGGELMLETQSRVIALMLSLRDEFSDGRIILVTHGDVVRSALLYWLGMPLDFVARLHVDLASVSALQLTPSTVELLALNWRPVDARHDLL